jgi:hypothetical protein
VTDIYQVGHLERLPLGVPYPAQVEHIRRLLHKLPGRVELAIDYTGVGRPVFDMFTFARVAPIGVLITSGTTESWDGAICMVPKIILISRVQALLHQGLLKIQRDLPEAGILINELQNFRVEYTASGQLTFNARSGKHDDLVLALSLAIWLAAGRRDPGAVYYEVMRRQFEGDPGPSPYFVGCDVGQSRDPTAICVVRRVGREEAGAGRTQAGQPRMATPAG